MFPAADNIVLFLDTATFGLGGILTGSPRCFAYECSIKCAGKVAASACI